MTTTETRTGVPLEGVPQSPERAAFMQRLHEHEDMLMQLLRVTGIVTITEAMVERVAQELSAEDGGYWDKHPQGIRDGYLHVARILLDALVRVDADGATLTEQYRMSWRKVVAAYDHASLHTEHR